MHIIVMLCRTVQDVTVKTVQGSIYEGKRFDGKVCHRRNILIITPETLMVA